MSALEQGTLHFDGRTIGADPDAPRRLGRQLAAVSEAMADGGWWTVAALKERCGGSDSSVTARIRDLRKDRFGGWNVEREHRGNGVWVYRLNGKREEAA